MSGWLRIVGPVECQCCYGLVTAAWRSGHTVVCDACRTHDPAPGMRCRAKLNEYGLRHGLCGHWRPRTPLSIKCGDHRDGHDDSTHTWVPYDTYPSSPWPRLR